jgi:hypothetical protein
MTAPHIVGGLRNGAIGGDEVCSIDLDPEEMRKPFQ